MFWTKSITRTLVSWCRSTKQEGVDFVKVSTKGRYALRVMVDLALHDAGAFIPLRDISERQDITVKYLEQIIPALNKAGYLRSARGNAGGYQLARHPREYTVGEILRATEGTLAPVACLDDTPNCCPRQTSCPTLGFWEGLNRVINDYVDSVTLQDLIDRFATESGDNYCI